MAVPLPGSNVKNFAPAVVDVVALGGRVYEVDEIKAAVAAGRR